MREFGFKWEGINVPAVVKGVVVMVDAVVQVVVGVFYC